MSVGLSYFYIIKITDFYPRSPCGERHKSTKLAGLKLVFLSTLSLRRATSNQSWAKSTPEISIHALLAESDNRHPGYCALIHYFYPRSPCGERHKTNTSSNKGGEFLSTLSLRRATYVIRHAINTHAISIHALLAESDDKSTKLAGVKLVFLSTLSLRRATLRVLDGSKSSIISIHALLAESDRQNWRKPQRQKTFLSTLSLRRATR